MQRLAFTALAIEGFAAATGRFPETLEQLTPKFLPEVPEDPFTGMELKYRHAGKAYVVYSVGPDRQDNGGLEVAPGNEARAKAYDLTFTAQR